VLESRIKQLKIDALPDLAKIHNLKRDGLKSYFDGPHN